MITGSIDVGKIDKTALYEGRKGKYLNITLIETPDSKYGSSHMIVQDIGKERREAGEKGPILGNCKTFERRSQDEQRQASAGEESQSPIGDDEQLPF